MANTEVDTTIQGIAGLHSVSSGVVDVSAQDVVRTLARLKATSGYRFSLLSDIIAINCGTNNAKFEINYLITSIENKRRLIVRTFIAANEQLNSVTKVYESAYWHECELYEKFGILFKDNGFIYKIYLTDHDT
ncbi:MAG: NADH-quinone oxidoreductase subunit C [Holosporales bacterium]|nr:NADH-quinone oxidoreductase subunit C [Holosporales bacterium]